MPPSTSSSILSGGWPFITRVATRSVNWRTVRARVRVRVRVRDRVRVRVGVRAGVGVRVNLG